ncbi:hypothetical protein GALMADRAFT_245877 [Galerina marginata CBS 339.88]|uniref:Uncharacterized protein n=1 Tax=Galerina marginata (strain CBS 339.88) TaxID=685588 RepID=A0A067TFK5_GALM3|nr:hypothetical protein GALMADRAFT_245877 [Galerina marginata CBS 339.88]
MDSSDPTLNSFFKSLINVQELCTDFGILKLLDDTDSNNSIFLPLLHTVRLERSRDLESQVITSFLNQRRNAGISIKTFDVGRCFNPVQRQLLFLNEIDGLQVVGWW